MPKTDSNHHISHQPFSVNKQRAQHPQVPLTCSQMQKLILGCFKMISELPSNLIPYQPSASLAGFMFLLQLEKKMDS